MGELLEVSAGPGPKRYDPNVLVPHHHLVCTSCGTLRDVLDDGTGIPAPIDSHGFVVTGVEVVYRGLCPDCAADPGARA